MPWKKHKLELLRNLLLFSAQFVYLLISGAHACNNFHISILILLNEFLRIEVRWIILRIFFFAFFLFVSWSFVYESKSIREGCLMVLSRLLLKRYKICLRLFLRRVHNRTLRQTRFLMLGLHVNQSLLILLLLLLMLEVMYATAWLFRTIFQRIFLNLTVLMDFNATTRRI